MATLLTPTDHADPRYADRRDERHSTPRSEAVDSHGKTLGVGELAVRGDNVMVGYWNRPDETADALRGGWMHTRDAGYLDHNGYLFVVDRIKDMVITGGENVYSAAVENAVLAHPDVLDCAVVGVPDDAWGERVHAVVVRRPGADLALEALQDFCRARLRRYKIPAASSSSMHFR